MCGIFSYISRSQHKNPYDTVFTNFNKIKNRGPNNTQYEIINNVFLGFHRLSINDVTSAGNQPMKYKDYYLICNGEIFNHLDSPPKTLTAKDHRPPYGTDGDYFSKPSIDDIVESVYHIMNESNPEKYPLK